MHVNKHPKRVPNLLVTQNKNLKKPAKSLPEALTESLIFYNEGK
jgi:hypothetical protein